MKKNLFEINNNSTDENGSHTLKACDPCAAECEKVNSKISKRKLSELTSEEVAHILNVFDK